MTAPPLMTKTHYSFEEAFRFIKSKYPNFTHENLLNHGFQGDISFFIKIPPDILVKSFFPTLDQRLLSSPPLFLTLYPMASEEIERNGIVHSNSYPNGYWFDEICQLIECLPNYNPINNGGKFWQTFKGNEICSIPITSKNLLVAHHNLIMLPQRIEAKLRLSSNSENSEQFFLIYLGRVRKVSGATS